MCSTVWSRNQHTPTLLGIASVYCPSYTCRLAPTNVLIDGKVPTIESNKTTVVSALGDPRRERPPDVYGHVINVPTHFNVPIHPSDERPPAMYGQFCLVPRVSVHGRYVLYRRKLIFGRKFAISLPPTSGNSFSGLVCM